MVVGYGKKIRKSVDALNKSSKKKYRCPNCSRVSLKRQSIGIWYCQNCKSKFASDSFKYE